MQVEGLRKEGSVHAEGEDPSLLKKNMFEQAKDAALGYQVEKPLINKLLNEVGLNGIISSDLGKALESVMEDVDKSDSLGPK